jgi:hypothetical protein
MEVAHFIAVADEFQDELRTCLTAWQKLRHGIT